MGREYPDQPVIGVAAVVWRDDHVLLIRRGQPPKMDEWSLPGGRQELGETVAEAARREVREETGVEIEVFDVVAVADLIDRDDDGRVRYHYTLVDLLGAWQAGDPTAGDDATDVAWVALADLEHYPMWSETMRVIRLADQRRKERAHARSDT